MVLVTSMGMLDVSFGVLATFASAKGWKLLAAVEVLLVLLFVRWFVGQGKRFMQKSRWEASLNVVQLRVFNSLDTDHDGTLSLEEMKAGHKKLGLTMQQAVQLYEKLDVNHDGVVSMEEFAALSKDEHITFAHATCAEGCRVMMWTPRRGMGKYVPLVEGESLGKFATYFSKFTPNQADWYYKNLKRQLLEAVLLNGLYPFQGPQVVALAVVQLYFSVSVALNKPYVLIAQSRAEFLTALGRAVTYLIAFAAFAGAIPMEAAVYAMAVNQSLMLLQAIFTQVGALFSPSFDFCLPSHICFIFKTNDDNSPMCSIPVLSLTIAWQMYPVYRSLAIWTWTNTWAFLLLLLSLSRKKKTTKEPEQEVNRYETPLRDLERPQMPPKRRLARFEEVEEEKDTFALVAGQRRPLERKTSAMGFGRGRHIHEEYLTKARTPRRSSATSSFFAGDDAEYSASQVATQGPSQEGSVESAIAML